jgi:fibronectin-binding autotransporter adhesin
MKPKHALRNLLALAGSSLLAMSSANAQSTYVWDNSNVTGTPTSPLDWFTGGSNPLGLWTGPVVPVSNNLNTIQFFQNTTTALTNTSPSTQISNINNGGAAFQLATLTLNGLGSATTGRPLTMTISGDALNFSAATGTINLNALIGTGVGNTSNITYNLDSNIQLGTASSVGALTIAGIGTGVFNIGGVISELQSGGGSLTKSGTSTVSLNNGNTYTGRTTITQGVLLLNHATALSGGIGSTGGTSNLSFNGTGTNLTVLGLGNGNFERSLGANTVAGAVTFTGNGGWAAYGADRTVNLGGAGAQITWATADTGFNGKSLILGAANATHTVTLENNLDLGSSARTVITGEGSAAIDGKLSGDIIGTGGLTKSGAGTLALSGTNTYSGTTTVGAGFPTPAQLIFQGKQAVSPNTTFNTRQNSGSTARLVFLDDSAGLINLGNSWTFNAENRQDTSANAHIFVGNNSTANGGNNAGSTQTGSTIALGAFISAPSSTKTPLQEIINITGANGYKLQLASLALPNLTNNSAASAYTMTMNPTTVPVIVAGGVTPFASGNTNSTPTIDLGGTATGNEIQGVIADPSNVGTSNPLRLTKSNTSTWTLTNAANTYTGTTTISGGTLQVPTITNGSSSSSIGASSNAAANLVLNGGTLRYTGGAVSTDRLFSLQASSTIDASGTGAVNFTNSGSMGFNGGTTAKTLTLTGTNTGNNTIAAAIGNNTGLTSITKTGIGTWVLSGANGNTGATNISGGGELILDYETNDNNKIAGILTTAGGTLTLKGGTHEEAVTSTAMGGAGGHTTIALSGGRTAAMNLGGITRSYSGVSAGATLSFAADNIGKTSTGNNTAGILGGHVTVGSNWGINTAGSIVALASYTPFATSGGTSLINYQLTGGNALTNTLATSTLRISNDANSQTLDLGANRNLTLGAQSSSIVGGLLYAGGNNDIYTITGTGTSRIQNANNNQETLFNIFTGTLNVEVFVGVGTGPVTKTGVGTLVLKTAANTYSGATYVNQGALRLENNLSAGTIAGGITVFNNAALELANSVGIGAEALTITGTGVSNAGALRNFASNTSSYAGAITIGNGGARINSDTSGALALTGGIATAANQNVTFGGDGNTTVSTTAITGSGNVIKDGSGTLTLSATNTYTGATTVTNGSLIVNGNTSTSILTTVSGTGSLGGSGTVGALTIASGGSHNPGNSPGIMNTGDYIMAGTLNIEAIGNTAGIGGYDQINVTGTVTLSGILATSITSGSYVNGDLLFILLNDGGDAIAGSFSNFNQGDVVANYSGLDWTISYVADSTGNAFTGGNDIALLAVTTIPEPRAAMLGAIGLLALLRRRR